MPEIAKPKTRTLRDSLAQRLFGEIMFLTGAVRRERDLGAAWAAPHYASEVDRAYRLADASLGIVEMWADKTLDALPLMWQPIETAPKDGTPILLGRTDGLDHVGTSTLGWWQDAEADGVDYMGADAGFVDFSFNVFRPGRSFGNPARMYDPVQPTHWMPLPPIPQLSENHHK